MSEDDPKRQPPLDRTSILARAKAARELFDEGQRRFTIKALCRDRFRSGPMYEGPPTDLSDDDIIEAAYGAGGARTYWRAWLLGASGRPELMQVIAAHCAVDQSGFHRIWRTLLAALDRAPPDGDLMADTRWLAENPNTRFYLPSSLEGVISTPTSPKPATPILIPTSGVPGRPTSKQIVLLQLAERAAGGLTLKTCKAEAEWLSDWLQREHPSVPQVGAHRLQTVIAKEYRRIPKSIPK